MDLTPYLEDFAIPVPEKAEAPEEFAQHLARLAEFDLTATARDTADAVAFYETLYRGEIPEDIPFNFTNQAYELGSSLTAQVLSTAGQKRGYYARATNTLAEQILLTVGNDKPALDVLAGSGFLTKALRQAGVPTIASDNHSWKFQGVAEKLDALEALHKYGLEASCIIIAWAPAGSTLDMELWETASREYPHLDVISISEGVGGCTGSDAFAEVRQGEGWEEFYYETTMNLYDTCTYHLGANR